jgi:hypothetical protein
MQPAIEKIVEWSNIARKEGLLRLEDYIQQEPDPFASKALQLLVDGKEPEEIRHILEMDMTHPRGKRLAGGELFRGAGRLRADHRHHRRGVGPDSRHGQLGRSQQIGGRHRRRVRRHHLRPGAGQRVRPADGQQNQKLDQETNPALRADHRGHHRHRPRRNPRNIESRLQGFTQN